MEKIGEMSEIIVACRIIRADFHFTSCSYYQGNHESTRELFQFHCAND